MGSAESKAEAEAKAKDKAESKAKWIMPRKFKYTSYQRLCELNFTGYTDQYLHETANFSTLTTTAKLTKVRKLAKYDLVGIEIF